MANFPFSISIFWILRSAGSLNLAAPSVLSLGVKPVQEAQHHEADSALARSPCLPQWVLLVLCSERHVGCGGDGWGLRGDSRGRRESLRRWRSTVGGRRVWKHIPFPVARKLTSKPQVVAEVVATSQLAHWHGPGTLLKCFQSRLLCHMQAASTRQLADNGGFTSPGAVEGGAASRELGLWHNHARGCFVPLGLPLAAWQNIFCIGSTDSNANLF